MKHSTTHWLGRLLILSVFLQATAALSFACDHEHSDAPPVAPTTECHDQPSHDGPGHAGMSDSDEILDTIAVPADVCCGDGCDCPSIATVILSERILLSNDDHPLMLAAGPQFWSSAPTSLIKPPPIQ